MEIYPYILAGGSGTRLWPFSRKACPKQFLKGLLEGELSLFQRTVLRLQGDGFAPCNVLANEEHRFLVAEQLRQLGQKETSIILEPVSRNTAPSAMIAALTRKPDDLILLLPSDQLIEDEKAFREAVLACAEVARRGDIITFGIRPTAPETGFGYIKAGRPRASRVLEVEEFVEKPDEETAHRYVRDSSYLWNAGIFLFSARTMIEAFERYAPEFLSPCRMATEKAARDLEFLRLDAESYAANPDLSIDYAIMEKADNIACKPLHLHWNDLGNWEALRQERLPDHDGNVTSGDVVLQDVHDSLVMQDREAPLLAVLGMKDVVALSTKDAVLLTTRERAQQARAIVKRLKDEGRPEAEMHARVHRPWGWYEKLVHGERYLVKKIMIKPGACLSLQSHMHRAEHWVVVSGTLKVVRGEDEFLITEDQSTYIPVGTRHRLENPGELPAVLIEVQTGSYLGEDDIVRYEDKYGRSSKEGD